ncbi:MAG: CHAD domain-containing protein [Acidimicrobiia bacterium]|nr:CHAD domain-containing protein [Acidimicrobiia bacterium]
MGVRRFAFPEGGDLSSLLAGVATRTPLVTDDEVRVVRTLYDTFDWRIWGDDGLLEHERPDTPGGEGHLVWRRRSSGEVLGRLEIDDVPRFVTELRSGRLADRLAPVVDVRAIEPLTRLTTDRQTLRMIDDDDKTVARVVVDRSTVVPLDRPHGTRAEPRTLQTTIEVVPVRGYPKAAKELNRLLEAQVTLRPQAESSAVEALRTNRRRPGDYSSKLALELSSTMTASEAWCTVLRTLLAVMHTNEDGVRHDRDPEFLHDYRVAIRRSRSVLAQGKGVLPDAERRQFADELRWLGGVTSPVRDLDVELLELPTYDTSLPTSLRGSLQPLADWLQARQRAAHGDLVAALDGERYRELLAAYATWLDHPGHDPRAPEAAHPSSAVAAARIAKAFRRVVRDGRRIDDTSPPESLHDLRKDTKKLRYALECYGSLFPPETVRPIVRHLKVLQDCLGEFQDCEVQALSLRTAADALLAEQRTQAATLMAIGHLVEHLDERQAEARAAFNRTFRQFDTDEVGHLVSLVRDHGRASLAASPAGREEH